MDDLKYKYNSMLEIDRYERAIIELSNWQPGLELSQSTFRLSGAISSPEARDGQIELLNNICSEVIRDKSRFNKKLYLSEIIHKEQPSFTSNNLILSPTGSGKSHFMKSLIKHEDVLFLVSTTSLKDKLVPKCKVERKRIGTRMYSTKHKDVYGEDNGYKILVMTYSEFGERIKYTSNFANNFLQIFCDEIHSLFSYHSINKTDTLLVAIKYLFEKRDKQTKYYFTATDEHLTKITRQNDELFQNVKVFNYLKHPDIVRHIVLSSYKINNLEQVRPHLIAKKDSFKYFGYKIFAFCKTIASQKHLEKIMISEGFNPLVLWSVNNSENIMSDEQLKQREYVLKTGLIPERYDSLIVNSSMQEGWDLLDPKVRLAIMNTTNKTEFIQAVGRMRKDVDVLVYRVNSDEVDHLISFPDNLINVPLTTTMKKEYAESLGLKNNNGRVLKWPSISKILEKQGFEIKTKNEIINNKSTRVSLVNY